MTIRSIIGGVIAVVYLGGISTIPVTIGILKAEWWYVAIMVVPCLFCLLVSIGVGIDIATLPRQDAEFRREVKEAMEKAGREFDEVFAKAVREEAGR